MAKLFTVEKHTFERKRAGRKKILPPEAPLVREFLMRFRESEKFIDVSIETMAKHCLNVKTGKNYSPTQVRAAVSGAKLVSNELYGVLAEYFEMTETEYKELLELAEITHQHLAKHPEDRRPKSRNFNGGAYANQELISALAELWNNMSDDEKDKLVKYAQKLFIQPNTTTH